MNVDQMRYLVTLAESRMCIAKASQRVETTQFTLMREVKKLEDQLGFQLLIRHGRSLQGFSPAGEKVLAHAQTILKEFENINAFSANERGERSGQLRIVTTHTEACYVLPPAISALRIDFPDIKVDLQIAADEEVLRRLAYGDTDLAVFSTMSAAPCGVAIPLFRWRRVVLVPRWHSLASRKKTPTVVELGQYPLISYEDCNHPFSSLRVAFAHAGVDPQIAMAARDDQLIKTYVSAGIGIGLVAEMAVRAEDHENFVVLPAPDSLAECTSWAVLPSGCRMRTHLFALLGKLAPGIDRDNLQEPFQDNPQFRPAVAPPWLKSPAWSPWSKTHRMEDATSTA